MTQPLPPFERFKRDEGSLYSGVQPPTLHPWIVDACQTADGINVAVLQAFKHSMTLDDLLDVREAKHVRESWTHAELLNQQAREIITKRKKAVLGS